jgi:hypothetical protein
MLTAIVNLCATCFAAVVYYARVSRILFTFVAFPSRARDDIASTPADVRDAIPHGRATQLKRAFVGLFDLFNKIAFPRRGDIPAIKELA